MDNNKQAIRKLNFHLNGRNQQIVPCLVGPTGIGKTTILNKVAKDMNAELIYFNMSQQNEGDNALPVPQYGDDKTTVTYALNHKFQEILDNPEQLYIVFCDELARAQIGVLSEWMTLLTERQVQGHKFGSNVRFVAAMNPSSSMKGYENTDYVATEMDPAHLTRFNFIYMEPDRLDWLEYAKEADVHPFVIQFLEDSKHIQFFYGHATNDVRMRTPKGWSQLSDMLKDLEEQGLFQDRAFTSSIINDQIGDDAGPMFAKMMWETLDTIPLDQIVTGKPVDPALVQQYANYALPKQILTMDGWLDEMKERDGELEFKNVDIANFVACWNALKSDDSKVKVAHRITHEFLKIKDGQMDTNSIAYRFYDSSIKESAPFVEFMNRMMKMADRETA